MLINPSSKGILENAGDRPPLGLLTIGAVLQDRGHHVRVRDMDHVKYGDLLDEIDFEPPEVAGVSVYTSPLYEEAVGLGYALREKGIRTVAGGYHATAMPESLTEYFDTVIVGEGETSVPLVVENPGLTKVLKTSQMDIIRIPHPDRNLVDMSLYGFEQDEEPASTSMTSRGCPNACNFCGNMNKKVRYHSDEYVIDEIRRLKSYGFNDIYFLDDAFTVNKKRTMNLLELIKDEGIRFRVTTRAKMLDEGLVEKLANAGCSWVSLGIESGSEERLKDVSKNMKPIDNYRAVKLIHKNGIKSKGFFMFGLPNESKEDAQKTIDFAKFLKGEGLTSADFYIMAPFPGTPIWNNPEKHGIKIIDRDYTKYLEAGKEPPKAFHDTTHMKRHEIEEVRNRAEEEWNGV